MSVPIGSLVLNQQFSPGSSVSATLSPDLYTPSPLDAIQTQASFADLAQRFSQVEWQVTANSVGKDNILSTIALSPEAVLIQSSRIGIFGEVTFFDWLRDVNGVSTGVLDPSITTIRGGVIHTGIIYNADNSNYLDLDATGSTPFLVSSSGVSIKANGQFAFGSASGNQLTFDGTNVALGGNTLLSGTLTSTVVSNAATGAAAYPLAASAMQANLANVLSGAGAVEYGSVSWSGGVASGTSAVAISANGIAGFSSTGAGFYISATTGNAVFTGNVSAGSVTSSTYIDVTGYVKATGNTGAGTGYASISGYPGAVSGTYYGVYGASYDGAGVYGTVEASGGFGVLGSASVSGATGVSGLGLGSGAIGVVAEGTLGALALQVSGSMTISSTTLVSNLNSQFWNGLGIGTATTGTGTVTIAANSPGASGNVIWLPLTDMTGTIVGRLMVAPA
jgi:hypothetical protein